MTFNKFHGKPFSVSLSKKEQEILDAEIQKQVMEVDSAHSRDVDTMVLYTVMKFCKFGKKRLHDFWMAMREEHDNLIKKYEMPNDFTWLAEYKLKEAGIDIDEWEKEFNA